MSKRAMPAGLLVSKPRHRRSSMHSAAEQDSVEGTHESGEDVFEKCFEVTAALKKCMDSHSDYYQPMHAPPSSRPITPPHRHQHQLPAVETAPLLRHEPAPTTSTTPTASPLRPSIHGDLKFTTNSAMAVVPLLRQHVYLSSCRQHQQLHPTLSNLRIPCCQRCLRGCHILPLSSPHGPARRSADQTRCTPTTLPPMSSYAAFVFTFLN